MIPITKLSDVFFGKFYLMTENGLYVNVKNGILTYNKSDVQYFSYFKTAMMIKEHSFCGVNLIAQKK